MLLLMQERDMYRSCCSTCNTRLYTILIMRRLFLGEFMSLFFPSDYYNSICKVLFNSGRKVSAGVDRVSADNYMRNLDENYKVIIRKCNNFSYNFSRFKQIDIGNRIISIPTCRDKVILEYLKNAAMKSYKITMRGRNKICSDLKAILSENIDYYVIRLDIKHFFSSIDQTILLNKLKKDSLFSIEEYVLIERLLDRSGSGVPQGVGISNYLSEIYLKSFDIEMRNLVAKTIYYERYVDDIIIIIPGTLNDIEKKKIRSRIDEIFNMHKLEINKDKFKELLFSRDENNGFDYLGYNFKKVSKELIIGISENKISIIKEKIDYAMSEYQRNGISELLIERIKDITMVHEMFRTKCYYDKKNNVCYKKEQFYYGTKYDYELAGEAGFKELNNHIKSWIYRLRISNRTYRRILFSVLFPEGDNQGIHYSPQKRKITYLRALVYSMCGGRDGTISWLDLLRMNKRELLALYQILVRRQSD